MGSPVQGLLLTLLRGKNTLLFFSSYYVVPASTTKVFSLLQVHITWYNRVKLLLPNLSLKNNLLLFNTLLNYQVTLCAHLKSLLIGRLMDQLLRMQRTELQTLLASF